MGAGVLLYLLVKIAQVRAVLCYLSTCYSATVVFGEAFLYTMTKFLPLQKASIIER